jgi:hypothetical protein
MLAPDCHQELCRQGGKLQRWAVRQERPGSKTLEGPFGVEVPGWSERDGWAGGVAVGACQCQWHGASPPQIITLLCKNFTFLPNLRNGKLPTHSFPPGFWD